MFSDDEAGGAGGNINAHDIAGLMPQVAGELLGDSKPTLSTPKELRFGNHGSVAGSVPV